jgi:hypothetical protein
MVKISKFPKIGQYREVVKEVQFMSAYSGKDDLGNAIYDHSLPKPTLKFKGLVKLHGTNAGVGHNPVVSIWVQSRTNIIKVGQDNAGFAFFVESNKEAFLSLVEQVRDENRGKIGEDDDIIIFGEWAGEGIQKGVAITGIPKSFFIFDVKIRPADETVDPYYVEYDYLRDTDNRIYNINDYLSYEIEIDFNAPERSQNKLAEITQAVEALCPVGKAFGVEGIGEGVVWSTVYNGHKLRFKVKGDKHSVTKVKKLASVDTEKLANIEEFVEYAVTENRIIQGLNAVFPNGELDKSQLGVFMKWMMTDILAEETDTLVENGLEPKDIGKYVSNKARTMFFAKYNDFSA